MVTPFTAVSTEVDAAKISFHSFPEQRENGTWEISSAKKWPFLLFS
jgi:hypothetical protein